MNKSMVLVRKMAPANWNILWLRELENMELSYDLQFDREYDDTLAQGCHLTFSALAVSGDLKGEEVIVYFKKVVGDRTSGDAYVVVEEGLVWMDTYIDDYALSFVAMMYEKAQLSNKPLGLWYRGEPADCRRFQYRPAIRGSRVTARYLSMSSTKLFGGQHKPRSLMLPAEPLETVHHGNVLARYQFPARVRSSHRCPSAPSY